MPMLHRAVDLPVFEVDSAWSDQELRRRMDESWMMLWWAGPDNSNLHTSPALLEYAGCTPAEINAMGWLGMLHPEDRERTLHTARQGFQTRKPFRHFYRFQRRDGTHGLVFDQALPRFRPGGHFTGYVGTMYPLNDAGTIARVRYQQAIQYMETHLEGPRGLAMLALAAGCSERDLQRAFRAMRQSPMQVWMSKRLDHARYRLLHPLAQTTVAAVAAACGYRRQDAFTQAYRKRHGELPSQTLRMGLALLG